MEVVEQEERQEWDRQYLLDPTECHIWSSHTVVSAIFVSRPMQLAFKLLFTIDLCWKSPLRADNLSSLSALLISSSLQPSITGHLSFHDLPHTQKRNSPLAIGSKPESGHFSALILHSTLRIPSEAQRRHCYLRPATYQRILQRIHLTCRPADISAQPPPSSSAVQIFLCCFSFYSDPNITHRPHHHRPHTTTHRTWISVPCFAARLLPRLGLGVFRIIFNYHQTGYLPQLREFRQNFETTRFAFPYFPNAGRSPARVCLGFFSTFPIKGYFIFSFPQLSPAPHLQPSPSPNFSKHLSLHIKFLVAIPPGKLLRTQPEFISQIGSADNIAD
jgi:hypothetical protein